MQAVNLLLHLLLSLKDCLHLRCDLLQEADDLLEQGIRLLPPLGHRLLEVPNDLGDVGGVLLLLRRLCRGALRGLPLGRICLVWLLLLGSLHLSRAEILVHQLIDGSKRIFVHPGKLPLFLFRRTWTGRLTTLLLLQYLQNLSQHFQGRTVISGP